jgi:drug/metabolite transporter (DMT)-like permease
MQRAALIMFVAMSLIPLGDSAGKLLTSTHGASPLWVASSRFFLAAVMIAPFVPRSAYTLLRNWRIWLRALILAAGITCIQMALRTEDVADVFAAFFIGPLISFALGALVLREPVTGLRVALIACGFAGVLIVVRPGFGGGAGLLWAVAAGTCYGVFLTATRWLAGVGTPVALAFTQFAIAALALLPFGLANLPPATAPVAGLTVLSATGSMLGNLLLLYANRIAPATQLAPLVYFQLIAAVGLGWAIFGALPDALTWIGLALIVCAGVVSARLRR